MIGGVMIEFTFLEDKFETSCFFGEGSTGAVTLCSFCFGMDVMQHIDNTKAALVQLSSVAFVLGWMSCRISITWAQGRLGQSYQYHFSMWDLYLWYFTLFLNNNEIFSCLETIHFVLEHMNNIGSRKTRPELPVQFQYVGLVSLIFYTCLEW